METKTTSEQFADTGKEIAVSGVRRPVLKLGDRFFVGETLCILNPAGHGGIVWSARDVDLLKYNVNFTMGEESGPGH